MDVQTASQHILDAMRDLNARRISPDECRARYAAVLDAIGQAAYDKARIAAVLHHAKG